MILTNNFSMKRFVINNLVLFLYIPFASFGLLKINLSVHSLFVIEIFFYLYENMLNQKPYVYAGCLPQLGDLETFCN